MQVQDPNDWIRFMAEEPRLIKRPIVVQGDQIAIGFDQTVWMHLVGESQAHQ